MPETLNAPATSAGHRISMRDNGPFVSAHCACGWRGPGRRARSRARDDAAAHTDSKE
ncbi:hypothetical protein JJV70_14800 [Streptomyces sp. JJ66]|uniref:hypothetical protein n=1 Tax=Streptomyces sp. JJ66 TaxID=2803843 RepID=UPI001C58D51C|nr:hypothetical protein [Streptomyces sp. JJ66]MBW1603346.1 hypothetical protein [Streptomyces sp. JJ66]